MTIGKLIPQLAGQLQEYSPTPELDARLIIKHVTGWKDTDIILKHQDQLEYPQSNHIQNIINELRSGKPLAYILGYTEFCGLKINVNEDVLIPRVETEQLAEIAAAAIKVTKTGCMVIEVGVGSGCLTIGTLSDLANNNKVSQVLLVEPSSRVRKVALANLAIYLPGAQRSVSWINRLTDTVTPNLTDQLIQSDVLIMGNPPYIPTPILNSLSKAVRDHEPMLALDGGNDGLNVYREINNFILEKQLTPINLLLEIGPEIAPDVLKLFEAVYPNAQIWLDMFGLERFYVGNPQQIPSTIKSRFEVGLAL